MRQAWTRFFGHPAGLALALLALLGCATATAPQPLQVAALHLDDGCAYRNVFVDADNPSGEIPARSDRARRAVLRKAYQMLPSLGLRSVRDRGDAYYRLYAQAWLDGERNTVVKLGLQDRPKLARHMFIAMMEDASFPYRGKIGAGFKMVFPPETQSFDALAERAMRSNWEEEAGQLGALCELAAKLLEDGTAIEQLRNQLIGQMKQVRQRARTRNNKHLRIDVEDGR